jgi:hypothetical protein
MVGDVTCGGAGRRYNLIHAQQAQAHHAKTFLDSVARSGNKQVGLTYATCRCPFPVALPEEDDETLAPRHLGANKAAGWTSIKEERKSNQHRYTTGP